MRAAKPTPASSLAPITGKSTPPIITATEAMIAPKVIPITVFCIASDLPARPEQAQAINPTGILVATILPR